MDRLTLADRRARLRLRIEASLQAATYLHRALDEPTLDEQLVISYAAASAAVDDEITAWLSEQRSGQAGAENRAELARTWPAGVN